MEISKTEINLGDNTLYDKSLILTDLGYKAYKHENSEFYKSYIVSPTPLKRLGYSFTVTIGRHLPENTVIVALPDPSLNFNLSFSKLILGHFPDIPFIAFGFPGVGTEDTYPQYGRYPTSEEIVRAITYVLSDHNISNIIIVAAKRATSIAQMLQSVLQTKIIANVYFASRLLNSSTNELKEYIFAYSSTSRLPTVGDLKETLLKGLLPETQLSALLAAGNDIKCGANFTRLSMYNSFIESVPERMLANAVLAGSLVLDKELVATPTLVFVDPEEVDENPSDGLLIKSALPDPYYIVSLFQDDQTIAMIIKDFLASLKTGRSHHHQ